MGRRLCSIMSEEDMAMTDFVVWLRAAGVRAIKTMAQAALSMLGGELIGLLEVDWPAVAGVAAMAGVASLLTSVAGLPEVKQSVTE